MTFFSCKAVKNQLEQLVLDCSGCLGSTLPKQIVPVAFCRLRTLGGPAFINFLKSRKFQFFTSSERLECPKLSIVTAKAL